MSLSFEDIYQFIVSLPNSEKVTLVGGQALNFWAELSVCIAATLIR